MATVTTDQVPGTNLLDLSSCVVDDLRQYGFVILAKVDQFARALHLAVKGKVVVAEHAFEARLPRQQRGRVWCIRSLAHRHVELQCHLPIAEEPGLEAGVACGRHLVDDPCFA